MPTKKATRTPKICRHATGQAYVTLAGQRHYLGRYDDPATHARGLRMLAEFAANGNRPRVDPAAVTVTELIVAYLEHCKATYRRADGSPNAHTVDNIRLALQTAREFYGDAPAATFGPLALRACINAWVSSGKRRTTCNKRLGDVKRCFKWAVAHEMLPPSVYQGLATVEGLRHGRTVAKESRVVLPVPEQHVFAIEKHVARPVWFLVALQWHTGARSGEILRLRRCDIDTSGTVWTAEIAEHKTSILGKRRTLHFGPAAQAVLREAFQGKSPFEYLFSPKVAEAERYAACPTHGHPNKPPKPRVSDRTLRDHYCPDTYRRAVAEGCRKANVPVFHPHRLRHSAAARIEREFGLAAAAAYLGHANVSVTRTYAKLTEAQAIQVAQAVG